MDSLFSGLIGSKIKVKLLTRLFINPNSKSYLRGLAREFDVSTNSVREELNQLTKTKLLKAERNGRQVYYMANQEHPLYPELKSIKSRFLPTDHTD